MCSKLIMIMFAIVIFIGIGHIGARLETKGFNNGICKRCGNKLRYFDTDSQGGRGYTCDKCDYTTWVSYERVDRKFREVSEDD